MGDSFEVIAGKKGRFEFYFNNDNTVSIFDNKNDPSWDPIFEGSYKALSEKLTSAEDDAVESDVEGDKVSHKTETAFS
jgi:hypothetical protein